MAFTHVVPLCMLAAFTCCASLPAQDRPSRIAHWQADLEVLAREFPARHKNAFFSLAKEDFEARVRAISERIPELCDEEIEVAFMGLIAAVGDSHSRVGARVVFEGPRLPLWFHWFADGVRILGASKRWAHLLGARVLSIEGHPLSAATSALERVEFFENEALMKTRAPQLLVFPKLLRALGLSASTGAVAIGLELPCGERTVERIAAEESTGRLERIYPKRQTLTDQRGRAWHHREFVADEGLLYVQYNRCATSKQHDLKAFTDGLVELCASGEVKTLVFDLRFNGGGNSMLGTAMFARLAAHPPLKIRRNVFCIIGRRTFSSAILNAMELEQRHGAVFIGEPTGGSPNHYGEVRRFMLPSSKLPVQYSTKYFRRVEGEAHTIAPDHLVESRFEDFLEGRDLVTAKVRSLVR